jgi:hypothetical protein
MITAVVMVGGGEDTRPPAGWVESARRAAARDLILQLSHSDLVTQIILVSPELGDLASDNPVEYIPSQPGTIHIGHTLTKIVDQFSPQRLLYFGGGAAPLLEDEELAEIVNLLASTEDIIVTNNQFASDWAGVMPASILPRWSERLPQDNMLGWVLSTEAGLAIRASSPGASSRLDIDTPADLLTLRLHPGTKKRLRQLLTALPLDTGRLEAVLAVLATPASQVLIAGRLGPEPWRALNRVTHCWLRVVSEERGMVSSGRLARGAVFSILADYLQKVGLREFVDTLAGQVQAAILDSRVLMAHHGRWPPMEDRFASDLGLVDQIKDPWLREFTGVIEEASIPILLGGHGLLSGDLFAFCDLL